VALGGVGLLLLALALWNLNRELSTLRIDWGPIVAFTQIALPALVIVYGAYRLAASTFNSGERWRVVGFGIGGLLLVGGGVYTTILVRLAEARTVGEPQYVMGVMMGLGAMGGAILGAFSVTARRDAREAERARDNFELLNSIIRHDILNSMMIVQSRAEFIQQDPEDDRVAEFADTILTQTDSVVDQVERTRAILQALETDSPRLEPVDLRDPLTAELETLRTTHEELTVELDLPDELPVMADDLVGDVLANVLSNAVEHNDRADPRIGITASVARPTGGQEDTDGTVELRIADNGPGVEDDLKDAVFRRDETGLHEDGTGSGFGLFFVDTMMEKYGGDVTIEDSDSGGAEFVFRFRAAEAEAAAEADARAAAVPG
jgi:signal transduction histidine kinase